MYSQHQEVLLAVVKRILHRDPKGTDMYVVPGISFGYKDLCSIGAIAPMCCNSA